MLLTRIKSNRRSNRDRSIIDKELHFQPFRTRPTGSPGIEGVRSHGAQKKIPMNIDRVNTFWQGRISND